MNTSALDGLLTNLCRGDDAAAAQVFLEYEPYLRKVVRRLLPERLRSKFDSVDVVQSVWGNLLDGFRNAGWRFANANQLRAFLVKVTRNRLLDHLRRQDRVLAHEELMMDQHLNNLPCEAQATPSQFMQADDLWRKMLALCPVEHRQILSLKRQGAPLEDICAATGLHAGSVRRILRNLASQLAVASQDSL